MLFRTALMSFRARAISGIFDTLRTIKKQVRRTEVRKFLRHLFLLEFEIVFSA